MDKVGPEPRLIRSRFDTRHLPAPAAREAWNEAINVVFDSRLRKGADGFFASVDAALIGDVAFGRIQGSAQDFDRSRYKIARDGMDGFILQFYFTGQSAARDGKRPVAGAGDLYVIDMAQPLATATTDHDQFSLLVPRRLLAPRLKQVDSLHLQVLPANMPLVCLLRDSLLSFHRNVDVMTRPQGEAVIPPLLDLAVAALDGRIGDETAGGVVLAQFDALKRYVDDHLMDGDLSIEGLVAAFGLSRRTIYRLFEDEGGFSTYITRRRLQRATTALRSAKWRHLSIADIAQAHGFGSAERFSRAFRREYRLSPRDLRLLSRSTEGASLPSGRASAAEWAHWVSLLGR
ncbi:helix-turn-helix domain-containing protein [Segnochrobactrum spirostomi]|uniref:Helix-turn-helix domain-containing protein n=1 Tax=Segnochrobactrum spirostomi TaxID=2608987 RepID=A0A6A7YA36_9HYPH|nr:helix-turn-helix domain-containing protein [Segnochrobactrum spirostomi]MQT14878.1 helix-turn-helix domain-containing protein [Segnochrobactrum spirostomi]